MDINEIIFGNKYKNMSDIPMILYINLLRSKNRYNNIIKVFKEHKITNYIRINGCDYINKNIKYIKNENHSESEHYCLFSHIKALKYFINETEENEVIICEDDCEFKYNKYFKKSFKKYLDMIPKDYDFCLLFDYKPYKLKPRKYIKNEDYGTVCYLVSRKGALKIIEKFNNLNNDFSNTIPSADLFLYNYKNMNNYVLGLVGTLNKDSLIHPDHVINHHIPLEKKQTNFFINYKLFH